MKEKSIIFSAQEVTDALAGLKVKKRIPFKHQPPSDEYVLATYLSKTRSGREIAKHQWITVDGLRVIDGKQLYFLLAPGRPETSCGCGKHGLTLTANAAL